MEFQESLELQDLLAGLEQQKPRIGGLVNRYERVLKFRNEADAKEGQQTLAALLPEDKRDGIAVVTAEAIVNGVTNYRLTIPSALLTAIKKAYKIQSQGSVAPEGGYVEQLEARSPFTRFAGPRQGSDDPAHPEKSVNTFMATLAILERPFDLCERLAHVGKKEKNKRTSLDSDDAEKKEKRTRHKYFASSGSYGLSFDSQKDADNAKRIFSKLGGADDAMAIEHEVISPKESYYWLKVPSEQASAILNEAKTLSAMLSELVVTFNSGDLDKAVQERTDLLELIEGMGLGSSHVAEQMARDVFRPKSPVR